MGIWDARNDEERDHWRFIPLVSVGPLRFGMRCDEVVDVLDPSRPGVFTVGSGLPACAEIPFAHLGVNTYYENGLLYCVAIDALTGPQVTLNDETLVGRVPSEVEQWACDHAKTHGLELRYTHAADPELADLGLIIRAQRAGDVVLSRPVFLQERAKVTWDYVPTSEWSYF
ncbi:hypothetical protein ACLQ3D_20225 [Micromonospora vinacea]|uniref:RES domain-containing protein n=1 Tax=Micromonospora vinacea TaxID=709878 RepID=A0ABS0JVB7_9ACTN|nr:hypothetical protein [Micromonospora vinacea]MBG6099953.1 hypothetical protein [Micromonospora vinacea]WTA66437.1 hypothetical protein OHB51_28795 [Micromonospora sp. NBC_00855]